MQIVAYSRVRLAILFVLMAGMTYVGFWAYLNLYGRGAFGGTMMAGVGFLGMLSMLRFMVDNRVLGFDWRGVRYFGLFGERTIGWDDLDGMEVEETAGARHLKLLGPFGTLVAPRVSERLLGGGMTIEVLLEEIYRAQNAPPPPIGRAAQSAAPVSAEPQRVGGFGRKGL